jgi:hypothetical protein
MILYVSLFRVLLYDLNLRMYRTMITIIPELHAKDSMLLQVAWEESSEVHLVLEE